MTDITRNSLLAAGLVLAGVIAGLLLAGGSYAPFGMHMGFGPGMMGGYGERGKSDNDAHFIEMMIPHHEGAIEMAKVGLQRAQHPELRALAERIIAAQQKEVDQMRSWYANWYGTEVPDYADYMRYGMGAMMGDSSHMFGDADELSRVSDGEFDRAFIDMMIPHHQMALVMTSALISQSARPEMRALSAQIQETQSAEISLMSQWLQDWY